jgi:hypothetical protein
MPDGPIELVSENGPPLALEKLSPLAAGQAAGAEGVSGRGRVWQVGRCNQSGAVAKSKPALNTALASFGPAR